MSLHIGPSSVVLAWPLGFEVLVRMTVVEKLVSCQHHGKSGKASFLHIDILVVILVKCPAVPLGAKSCVSIQLSSSPVWISRSFSSWWYD